MTRRGAALALAVLVVASLLAAGVPAFAASSINGGGSSFAALEIDQWRADTARNPYNLGVNYVSQGSTFGRQEFSDGNLDFGASDIVFQSNEVPQLQGNRCGGRDPSTCFVYVPVSAGGLAFMYNLTDSSGGRLTNLKLTREAACKIFTGAITKWNDPAITATNPQLGGYSHDIVPVIRADGAGESFVLSQFCIAVEPAVWQAFIQDRIAHDPANVAQDFRSGSPVSNWPAGFGRAAPAQSADGVANVVADPVAGRDSITYLAAGYAKVRSFPTASLQNAAGVYTQPDENNVTVALGYATGRPDGTFDLNFTGPDPRAYFPSTYSYVLAQTSGWDPAKGATLGQFLCYAISQGQVIAPDLRYARLSKPLVDIAINAISKIPGAPGPDNCYVAGAPPPPDLPSVEGGPGATTTGVATADPAAASASAAAAAQAAAEAAAKAKAAKEAAAKQRSIDDQLASAANTHRTGSSNGEAVWLLLGGGLVAAAVTVIGSWRRGSTS